MGADAAGDVLYYNGTDYQRLGIGTASQHLATNSAANAPEWVAPPAAATATASGTVELATQAEVNTGTDTARSITPATLAGRSGTTVQMQSVGTSTVQGGPSSGAGIFFGQAIPTITEGFAVTGMAITYTPKSATNILVVEHVGMYSTSGTTGTTVLIWAGNTCVGAGHHGGMSPNVIMGTSFITVKATFVAGTTNAIAFTIRAGGGGVVTVNGRTGVLTTFGTVQKSTLVITEYIP